ncbi:hypothetical protein SLEP1_g7562 [Rubroshorea leprosula]|uniref:Uncharacterized protein n=1 Tax=Rubroshorea leprosula TaxID=152421 RepID=A0AAV5I4K2_9ROSI|nr:hypothetical protein SLEP1_g7562 [Rubroshorea leprosula]
MEGMSKTVAVRRPKWRYPQPVPTPRILHLPRRPRRKQTKAIPSKPTLQRVKKGKLETLFEQERSFSRGVVPVVLVRPGESEERRRERVEEGESGVVAVEEEKWRFQAEMLRAECNLLRMEREITIKKMERRRVQMDRMLRSAIQTLLSGRKKISEGKNVSLVLEEEMGELVEKLNKLQKQSVQDLECKNNSYFDKQASFLQRRLEKFGGMTDEEICIKEIREMAEATMSIKTSSQVDEGFVSNRNSNVEILRRKMEGLSKGMLLGRMEEEYGSVLSTSNSSVASSASNSRRIEFPDISILSLQQPYKDTMSREGKSCCGCCKAILRKILEQVRAETEQWSQMQEMLGQVRDEIEELQASRDFWEDRALDSDNQIQSLQSAVKEWRQKAASSEAKANELQEQVSLLQGEIERLQMGKEMEASRARNLLTLSQEVQNETEKRVLVCHLKENCHSKIDIRRRAQTCSNTGLVLPKRLPLQDIANISPLILRQQNKANIPLDCGYKEKMRQKKGGFLP